MKIGLVSSVVPFIGGGLRTLITSLGQELEARGHNVERILVPITDDPDKLHSQMRLFKLLPLQDFDRVIAIRFPSHFVDHPKKVVWFIHHHRLFYDLWASEESDIPDSPYWRFFRDRLRQADSDALRSAYKVFSNSGEVSARLRNYNNIEAPVLYLPLPNAHEYLDHGSGEEVVAICRLEPHKRINLLVDAMRYVRTPVRLVIRGAWTPHATTLIRAARPLKNISIKAEWISEETKRKLIGSSLAVAYPAKLEDSYGYPVLEAAAASKPAIVCTDGGGVTEFVRNMKEGIVAEPNPLALARAFDQLWSNQHLATSLGEASAKRVSELGIGWDSIIKRLLE